MDSTEPGAVGLARRDADCNPDESDSNTKVYV